MGGDSSALNDAGANAVGAQPWSGRFDSLSAGNGNGRSEQETRPSHRGKVQRRGPRQSQPNALELTVSARHRCWNCGPGKSSEP